HLEEFRRRFDKHDTLCVPNPIPEFSSDRVLVMEWLEGKPLSSVASGSYPPEEATEIARAGAEIYLDMIFDFGLYHADPHPGNLLLMEVDRIGLLDFGQVGRIDESLREDIVEMLLAIVDQDPAQLAAVLTRVGSTPAGLDERALHHDLADFTGHYAHQSVDRFELAAALTEMLDLLNRHGIILPSTMSLLLKVLVMLEGTGGRLTPNFSLMEVLQPYRKRMMAKRLSPTRQLKKARRIAYELEQLAEVVPRRLRDILQQVQTGSFDVHLDHRGLEPSVNRLGLGMLTSALFSGSVLLVTNDVWPIRGVSTPGFLGMILSAGLGMRLLRAINKSGHLDRRK
ncbi:MAG: AarF/UbiB family protein, partial [Lacipirellulaceae bacterium]